MAKAVAAEVDDDAWLDGGDADEDAAVVVGLDPAPAAIAADLAGGADDPRHQGGLPRASFAVTATSTIAARALHSPL
jgi:hypothetical protein